MDEGDTDSVNPGEGVPYVEYDTEGVFDWLCDGELDALMEFVFEELLEAKGVLETLCLVEDDQNGDTDILGLKLFVEVADEHEDPIIELVRSGDTDNTGVWETFDVDDTVIIPEGVGVNPGDGVNIVVLDWTVVIDTRGVIELDTDADEDVLGEASGLALSETFWTPVWEATGVWENVVRDEAEFEGNTETEAVSVVEDEMELEELWEFEEE